MLTPLVDARTSSARPLIETRYARSGDLSIAWQCIGRGASDLLIIPGLISHVEAFHELPGYTMFLSRLAGFARVITFDKRGNGLSDRVAAVPSLPERLDDVRAVLDAVGSRRTALLGLSEGGALALHFAATDPDRVVALAMFGAFPRLLAAPGYEAGLPPEAYEQFAAEMTRGWGTGGPMITIFGPSLGQAHSRIRDVAARCERLSATPTTMRRLWRMNASIDVRDAVSRVRAPTLVMHRTGDHVCPSPRRGGSPRACRAPACSSSPARITCRSPATSSRSSSRCRPCSAPTRRPPRPSIPPPPRTPPI